MTAQIWRDDVVIVTEVLGNPIPVATMIAAAVNQDHGRRIRVTPIGVVQSQALRKIGVGGGAQGNGHRSNPD